MQERGSQIDAELRTLTIRGVWQGKPIEIQTIERRFPLQTPFRLRQELPDGW